MDLNPNIILSGQAPQLENPMDALSKVITLRTLANKSQLEQQQFNDNQAMRNAYQNNMKPASNQDGTPNPNGTPQLDQRGMLSDLAKTAPHLVPQAQGQFYEMQKARTQAMIDHLNIGAQILGGVKDQPSYDQAKWQANQMGGDVSQWPQQYDPNWVKTAQQRALSTKDQIENQFKESGQAIEQKKADVETKKLDLEIQKTKDAYTTHAEDNAKAFRSDPAAMMASTRLGAVSGGKATIDPYRGHEDDMPLGDIYTLATERAKAATGGIPNEKDIEAQLPRTLKTKIAEWKSSGSSKMVPANAGDWVRNNDSFFRDMEVTARNDLIQRQKEVTSDPRLSPAARERISKMGIPPLHYTDAPPSTSRYSAPPSGVNAPPVNSGLPAQSHPQAQTALQWAQSNPNDPRSAAILQRLGK